MPSESHPVLKGSGDNSGNSPSDSDPRSIARKNR
jgi:hypothetical protein